MQKLNRWYVPEDVKQRYQQLHLGWQEMDTRIASGDTGWYQNHIEDFVGRIDSFVLALQHYTEHKIQLVIFMSLTGGFGHPAAGGGDPAAHPPSGCAAAE